MSRLLHSTNWSVGLASTNKLWSLDITRTAEKQITKLDRQAKTAIVRFLRERIEGTDDPRRIGKALHGDRAGLWRYRVGDYRLICEIQDAKVKVLLLEVGHRKDIYR